MKKLFSLALLLVLMGSLSPAKAQNQNLPDDVQQSGDILKNLDSLMKLWYLKNTTYNKAKKSENIYGYRADEVPTFSDSVYSSRIEKINSPLPYVYNDKVKGFINLYAVRKRQQVEKMLGLSEFYFPIYEEVLDKYNMPLEIKYLSVVESALNPRAVSRVGATGLWQFMYTTGIMYKLNVDSYVDDRKDPYESTEAAALFLKDLHNLFGDWFLAIAAYNCGPGNVNKAIRRSGGKRT
ncbi:MAG: lytic transglycosylase domain-containing protein, partial [Bacteroidia bacterium]